MLKHQGVDLWWLDESQVWAYGGLMKVRCRFMVACWKSCVDLWWFDESQVLNYGGLMKVKCGLLVACWKLGVDLWWFAESQVWTYGGLLKVRCGLMVACWKSQVWTYGGLMKVRCWLMMTWWKSGVYTRTKFLNKHNQHEGIRASLTLMAKAKKLFSHYDNRIKSGTGHSQLTSVTLPSL